VSSTDPSFGDQGSTVDVHIFGSGFTDGAQATWMLNGTPNDHVHTNSTTVISSTELVANVTISSDAELAFWDVQVSLSNGKNGVGSDAFEVTSAIPIGTLGGTAEAHDASGTTTGTQIVGWTVVGNAQHAFAWPDASGNLEDLGLGYANAIDVAGTTIAGSNGSQAVVWTRAPSGWAERTLPVQAGTPESRAIAVASGPDGRAILIGGEASVAAKHASYNRPVLWQWAVDGWVLVPLALPRSGSDVTSAIQGVNARGQAVGGVQNGGLPTQGVFWDSLGRAQTLPGDGFHATGIDAGGRVISGASDGGIPAGAVYWTAEVNPDGTRAWSGPLALPGGCQRAVGIDDEGDIIGNRCQTSTGSRYISGIWSPPYTSVTSLTGLGDVSDGGAAWGISRDGSRIVGGAPTGGANTHRVAVMWLHVTP
jgi:hypothetical protein